MKIIRFCLLTGQDILKVWLSGTTCRRDYVKRSVLLENETHVVLKHNSHAEYCGRGTGTLTCGVYAALYAKSQFEGKRVGYGGWDQEKKKWEGRVNLKRIVHECKLLGINFE